MVNVRRLLTLRGLRKRIKPVPRGAYLVVGGVNLVDQNGNKLTG